jgi:lipopolysaccharide export system protein LptC
MTMVATPPLGGRFEKSKRAPVQVSAAGSFAQARRHSAHVRLLRWAIPVGVATAVAGLLLVWLFDPFREVLPSFGASGFHLSATQVVMEKPKLAGFKKDNRPYEVVAKSAVQDVSKPQIVKLDEMDARIVLSSGETANLIAKTGIYDTQNETLDVKTNVRIKTTGGYDIHLESASIKFKTGDISSSQPVNVKMNNGEIDANSLEMVDNGRRVTFLGNVRSRMEPPSDEAGNKQIGLKDQLRQ